MKTNDAPGNLSGLIMGKSIRHIWIKKENAIFQQLAEMFPYMTLYRILSTEIGFKKADVDESGVSLNGRWARAKELG